MAISENRPSEVLLYSFASIFVVIGVFVIIWSLTHSSPFEGIVGVASSLLFFPAMRSATQIRKENLLIRLMEVPLTRAETADEAAKILTEMFRHSLKGPLVEKAMGRAEATP
jgi:hypothetical protein